MAAWQARTAGQPAPGGPHRDWPAVVPQVEPRQARWGQAILDRRAATVESTPEGSRNHTLNAAGVRCYRLALAGAVTEDQVTQRLQAAGLDSGLPERECRRTLRSARDKAVREGPATDLPAGDGELTDLTDRIRGPRPEGESPGGSSWAPVDLTAHLDGSHVPEVPALLRRTDGRALLYPGRVHSARGERIRQKLGRAH
jgi:hypothetical protein